jgi:1-acyl-sn-glycerol-3-phosphate acyltransferase
LSLFRFICRLSALTIWVVLGLCAIILLHPFIGQAGRGWTKTHWSRVLLVLCGILTTRSGSPLASGPVLFVSNHVSWLDIFLLNAARPTVFVAKSEIRRWPLLGWLVAGADTIFIERASRHAVHKVGHAMQERFAREQAVGLFPEGTTSPGYDLLPFYANLFEPARKGEVSIQPVALVFYHHGRRSDFAAFVGEETLVRNLWRVLGGTGVAVKVVFLAPIWSPDGSEAPPRSKLGHLARQVIQQELVPRDKIGPS